MIQRPNIALDALLGRVAHTNRIRKPVGLFRWKHVALQFGDLPARCGPSDYRDLSQQKQPRIVGALHGPKR